MNKNKKNIRKSIIKLKNVDIDNVKNNENNQNNITNFDYNYNSNINKTNNIDNNIDNNEILNNDDELLNNNEIVNNNELLDNMDNIYNFSENITDGWNESISDNIKKIEEEKYIKHLYKTKFTDFSNDDLKLYLIMLYKKNNILYNSINENNVNIMYILNSFINIFNNLILGSSKNKMIEYLKKENTEFNNEISETNKLIYYVKYIIIERESENDYASLI